MGWSLELFCSPERIPLLSSLAKNMTSCQHFGDWRTGVSLFSQKFSLETSLFSLLFTTSSSMVLDCPQSQIFFGSTLLDMNCFLPWSSGRRDLASLLFFCLLSTCSLILHSIPHPHLLRYLAHQIPEHFQNLAVQNNLLFVDSYPYKVTFHSYVNAVPRQLPFVYSLLSLHSVVDISSLILSPLSFFLSFEF